MEHTTEQIMREDPRAWNDSRERTQAEPQNVTAVAKEASLGDKWRAARPSKTVVMGLMVAAVVLTLVVGFNWGGWVTSGTALTRADTAAQAAITGRLAPICVAQFNQNPQKAQQLVALKAMTSFYTQADYVAKQGWATMPGEKTPNSDVVYACARLLTGS